MKKLLLILFALVCSASLFAQNYPHLTVKDIQYIEPDSLNTYFDFPLSPYNGDTVTVTGVVMESPYKNPSDPGDSVIMYVGTGNAGFFMQDTAQDAKDWSGIFVINSNDVSGGPFSMLDSGLIVNITGVVDEYTNSGGTQKTTELSVINFSAQNVVGQMTRPAPERLTLDSLKINSDQSKPISVKWEGVYVEFDSVTTTDRTSTGSFKIFGPNGVKLSVYNRSNYYYNNIPAPLDGSIVNVRGYLETRSDGSGGGISILPAYPGDVQTLIFPPSITNILRDPAVVSFNQSVDITADISDLDGTVDSVKLIWQKNGGAYQVVPMAQNTTTNWIGTIQAQSDSSFIDYFIWAKDNDGNVSMNPADTSRSRYSYFVLDHDLTIQHIQYSPFGSGYSSYNGYQVQNIVGVVTADTTDIEGNETGTSSSPQVYIQNGQGPWSGIHINGTEVLDLRRGDKVAVTGTVGESNGVTLIDGINSPSNITLLGTAPLPNAQPLSTSEIDLSSGGTLQAEQWEGVLVKYQNITVTDENADGNPGPYVVGENANYGDILAADSSGENTRIDLEDGTHDYNNWWFAGQDTLPTYVSTGSSFESVRGIMWYSFGNYKLIPRKNDDFVGFVTDVKPEISNQPIKYQLNQNYPNPFNPSTIISYSIPKAGFVVLKIYNILGQEVTTLVNQTQSAGNYKFNFNASRLSSGIYFYRLTSGNYTQIKKMILLK